MTGTNFDSSDQEASRFRPHGRVRLRTEGRLLMADADGPFNLELLQLLRDTTPAVVRELIPLGRWGNFCEYHGSAMATPEALHLLDAMLQASHHDTRPVCTAYVIAPGVEGAGIMDAIYERAYVAAGLRFRVFSDTAKALAWLREELAHADAAAATEAPPKPLTRP